jgi:hypothetical protein
MAASGWTRLGRSAIQSPSTTPTLGARLHTHLSLFTFFHCLLTPTDTRLSLEYKPQHVIAATVVVSIALETTKNRANCS